MTIHRTCPICNGSDFETYLQTIDYSVSHETFQILKCRNCQFLMTDPIPANLGKYYESSNYVSHSDKPVSLFDKLYYQARRYTLDWKEKLVRQNTSHSSNTLLDYGCGTGDFLAYCQKKKWNINGIEPSPIARNIANQKTNTAIAENLSDIKANHYDAITLWHVLEHVERLNETMESLNARLKQNGTMFIAVPNYKSHDAQHYKEFWAAYDVPRHLWHFSQTSMQQLMAKHKLKLQSVIPMKLDSFYVALLSEKYKTQKNESINSTIKATYRGLYSNIAATNSNEYSSLIYIATK